jgi:drug/metabolite transporter (DMT)-like permease
MPGVPEGEAAADLRLPPAADSTPGPAIAFLVFGVASGLGLDLCAKWLLADYPLPQFILLRSIFGLSVFVLIARWYGGNASLVTRKWPWHLLRTALATGAMFGFFYGLAHMPLVNALTLGFTAPLILTALSGPVLGDRVGIRRWLAVVAGFIGVLIVLRPAAGMVTPAALAVIGAAACYAGLALTARKLAATESSLALSVYVISGPLLVSALLVADDYRPPSAAAWAMFALAGLCSACAWVGIVGGYRRASPALLAPFEYLALIGGAAAGYLIWNEVPDRWVVVGGAVIIASGLFVVYREVGPGMGTALSNRYRRAVGKTRTDKRGQLP